jgi:hypothetical protein
MMRLLLATKPTEEIDKKTPQIARSKSGQKYLRKSQKWKTLQQKIGDDLTQTHSNIDVNQEFTRCRNHHDILPLFRGLEVSLTFSPLLHHEAHPHLSNNNFG